MSTIPTKEDKDIQLIPSSKDQYISKLEKDLEAKEKELGELRAEFTKQMEELREIIRAQNLRISELEFKLENKKCSICAALSPGIPEYPQAIPNCKKCRKDGHEEEHCKEK